MIRENTPTDNSVAERFTRTFKNHKIYNTTIEEKLSNSIAIEPNFKSYRATSNSYVNNKPNKKSVVAPHKHDTDISTASMLMVDTTKYPQARSKHVGTILESMRLKNLKQKILKL